MRLLSGFVLCIALFSSHTDAGARGNVRFLGSLGFLVDVPQGDFRHEVDRNGYGITGRFGLGPAGGVVLAGIEGDFAVYGHESRTEPFSTTIPDVTVKVTTDNSIIHGGLFVRLQGPAGPIRPYVDASLGLNYLYTTTTITDENGGEDVASSTNFYDTTTHYGAAMGIMVPVFTHRRASDAAYEGIRTVMIDASARYLAGGNAEYLKQGSIRRTDGGVVFDIRRSDTDVVGIQVGMAAEF